MSEAIIYTLGEATLKDTVYPPGADTTNINQGRKPLRVDRYHDPETGDFAYYRITI
ncbi:hypothetical protein ACN28S_29950 [Cystobacter fuscus]